MKQKSGYNQSTLESEAMSAFNTAKLFKRIPHTEDEEAQALAGKIACIDEMATRRDFGALQASMQHLQKDMGVLQKDMEHLATKTELAELRSEVKTLQSKMEHLATKTELAKLRSEVKTLQSKMEHLATKTEVAELRSEVKTLQSKMEHVATKTEVADLRTELKTEIAELRTAMEAMEKRMFRWFLVTITSVVGILLAELLPLALKLYFN